MSNLSPLSWRAPLADLADRRLALATLALLLLGLWIAPRWSFELDTVRSFLPWARATGGMRPWGAYLQGGCVYPPVVPYWLTCVEALRQWVGAPELGSWAIALLKLPNVLACAAGVGVCRWGLVPVLGVSAARQAAWYYALCLPLWVNAALWGQFEALLSLALVSALVAACNGRFAWVGAALGWAVAIKLQAISVAPVLVLYAWRRGGWPTFGRLVGAGAGVLVLWSAPYVMAGAGPKLLAAYATAVDFFPRVSYDAFNVWFIVDLAARLHDPHLGPLPDNRVLVGLLTFKRLALIVLGGYVLDRLVALWKRPTPAHLAASTAIVAFAFFMLPTQMHERYLVPAAALMAVAAAFGQRRWLFWGLCLTASANQLFVCLWFDPPLTSLADGKVLLALLISLANIALFGLGSRGLFECEPTDSPSSGSIAAGSASR